MSWLVLRDGRPVESCRSGWFARAFTRWLNEQDTAVYEVTRGE